MTDLLKEESKTSSMRASMFILVLTGCMISIIGVVEDRDLFEVAVLALMLIGPGITGKVAQKNIEVKNANRSISLATGSPS